MLSDRSASAKRELEFESMETSLMDSDGRGPMGEGVVCLGVVCMSRRVYSTYWAVEYRPATLPGGRVPPSYSMSRRMYSTLPPCSEDPLAESVSGSSATGDNRGRLLRPRTSRAPSRTTYAIREFMQDRMKY